MAQSRSGLDRLPEEIAQCIFSCLPQDRGPVKPGQDISSVTPFKNVSLVCHSLRSSVFHVLFRYGRVHLHRVRKTRPSKITALQNYCKFIRSNDLSTRIKRLSLIIEIEQIEHHDRVNWRRVTNARESMDQGSGEYIGNIFEYIARYMDPEHLMVVCKPFSYFPTDGFRWKHLELTRDPSPNFRNHHVPLLQQRSWTSATIWEGSTVQINDNYTGFCAQTPSFLASRPRKEIVSIAWQMTSLTRFIYISSDLPGPKQLRHISHFLDALPNLAFLGVALAQLSKVVPSPTVYDPEIFRNRILPAYKLLSSIARYKGRKKLLVFHSFVCGKYPLWILQDTFMQGWLIGTTTGMATGMVNGPSEYPTTTRYSRRAP